MLSAAACCWGVWSACLRQHSFPDSASHLLSHLACLQSLTPATHRPSSSPAVRYTPPHKVPQLPPPHLPCHVNSHEKYRHACTHHATTQTAIHSLNNTSSPYTQPAIHSTPHCTIKHYHTPYLQSISILHSSHNRATPHSSTRTYHYSLLTTHAHHTAHHIASCPAIPPQTITTQVTTQPIT